MNMRRCWLLLQLIIPVFLMSEETRVFPSPAPIEGTWQAIASFAFSTSDRLNSYIYSEYIAETATSTYRGNLEEWFDKSQIIQLIHFGAENEGYLVQFRSPEVKVKMLYGDSGRENGTIRIMPVSGDVLWLDYIHLAAEMLLIRIFTNGYATNNGYYLIASRVTDVER